MMQKKRLRLDDLEVESFNPGSDPESRGTVMANQQSGPYTDECQSCGSVCGGCNTEYPCGGGGGSATCTCPGYYTCAGVHTCGDVDTCRYPECTSPGAWC